MAHRAGERRRRCGQISGEGNGALRAGRTDSGGVGHGVLGVGTEEGKRAEAQRCHPAPFWEGRWGSGNWADVWRKRGTSRGRREADGWPAATGPGGGVPDE
jgi:hypothetical protein